MRTDHVKIKKEEFDISHREIAIAESVWNCKLPKDYVDFLLEYNGAIVYPDFPNLGPENKSELWEVERFFSLGDVIIQKLYPMTYTLTDVESDEFETHNLAPEKLLVFAQGVRGIYFFNLSEKEHGHVYIANYSGGDGISRTSAESFTAFFESLGLPEWEEEGINPEFQFSNDYHTGLKVMQSHMFHTPDKPALGLQRFKEVFEYTRNQMPKDDGYPSIIHTYVDDRLKLEYLVEEGCDTKGLLVSANKSETIQYLIKVIGLDVNESYKNIYPLQKYLRSGPWAQFAYEVMNDLIEMNISFDWSIRGKLNDGSDDITMLEKLRILHHDYLKLQQEENKFRKKYGRPSGRPPFIKSHAIEEMLGLTKRSWLDQFFNRKGGD